MSSEAVVRFVMFVLALVPSASAGSIQFTAGGFVSVGLGRSLSVGYGVDVSVPYVAGGVNYPEFSTTVGPFVRAGFGDALGVVAGARGGVRWVPDLGELYLTPEAELGAALRPGRAPSVAVGVLSLAGWPGAGPYAALRASWELAPDVPVRATGDVTVGVLGYLDGGGYVSAGRALRHAEGNILPVAYAAPAASREFVEAARSEWASVPAFLRLAAELRLLGAPPSLVGRALAAARDESVHVDDCLELAGAPLALGPMPLLPPRVQPRGPWLALLAAESEIDGVVGEGEGARVLEERARARRDTAGADRLARMAVEERAHADLAKDIVSWARTAG